MNRTARGWVAVVALNLVFLVAGLWSSLAVRPLTGESTKLGGVRLIADNFDRLSYLYRGTWLRDRVVPYRDRYSDYPVPMTVYFGLPFLVSRDAAGALTVITVGNFLWFLLLLGLTLRLTDRPAAALLLYAFPLTAWFIYNRYDVIPAALVVLFLWLLKQERIGWGAVALGLAINVKWYPAVFVIPTLLYLKQREGSWRRGIRLLAAIIALTAVIHLAGWLVAGPASFEAYLFHRDRGVESASLYGLGAWLLESSGLAAASPALAVIPLAGWAALLAYPFVARPRTFPQLVAGLTVAAILLLATAKIFSPQWVLWVVSLAVLAAPTRRTLALAIGLMAATYCRFPVAYDLVGDGHWLSRLAAAAVWALLFLLLADRGRAARS